MSLAQVKVPDYIMTFSGLKVNPLTLTPNQVRVEDVANSLAGQNRWLGHSRPLFSVAAHTLLVCWIVKHVYKGGAIAQLLALTHDGEEAYLGDLPHPIKTHTDLGREYRKISAPVQATVETALVGAPMSHFGSVASVVRAADARALAYDVALGMPGDPEADYHLDPSKGIDGALLARYSKLIRQRPHEIARRWCRTYASLYKRTRGVKPVPPPSPEVNRSATPDKLAGLPVPQNGAAVSLRWDLPGKPSAAVLARLNASLTTEMTRLALEFMNPDAEPPAPMPLAVTAGGKVSGVGHDPLTRAVMKAVHAQLPEGATAQLMLAAPPGERVGVALTVKQDGYPDLVASGSGATREEATAAMLLNLGRYLAPGAAPNTPALSITAMAVEAHRNSTDKGFWGECQREALRNPGAYSRGHTVASEKIALIHSEVSEALEELRVNPDPRARRVTDKGKPEGFGSELADAVIRCGDLAEGAGVDLEAEIKAKLEYNRTRPAMHGKAF